MRPNNCKTCGGKMQQGGSFGKAFATARKSGLKTFEWNGKKYTTELKEEMEARLKSPTPQSRPQSKPAPQNKPVQQTKPVDLPSTSTLRIQSSDAGVSTQTTSRNVQAPTPPPQKKQAPKPKSQPKVPPQVRKVTSNTGNPTVDYFADLMAERGNKIFITDKGTKTTYYGTPGDIKSFPVLSGVNDNPNAQYSSHSLDELAKNPEARITPTGSFPVRESSDIYGTPGLYFKNGVAYHTAYPGELKERTAALRSTVTSDNNMSYGCVNCEKPNINALTNTFNTGDSTYVIDSRLPIAQNLKAVNQNHQQGGLIDPNLFRPKDEELIPGQNVPYYQDPTAPEYKDRVQEGIAKGLIDAPRADGPDDQMSAQQWYDYVNTPPNKKRNPATPKNWRQNLGIGMMGIRTLLSEISGRVARSRQNDYDYTQQAMLGQMNPMPTEGYQPNPYSLYAKYGGKLKHYQQGGDPFGYGKALGKKNIKQYMRMTYEGIPQAEMLNLAKTDKDFSGVNLSGIDPEMVQAGRQEEFRNDRINQYLTQLSLYAPAERQIMYPELDKGTFGKTWRNFKRTEMENFQNNPISFYTDFSRRNKKPSGKKEYAVPDVQYQQGGPTYASLYGKDAEKKRLEDEVKGRGILERSGDPNAATAVFSRSINDPILKIVGDIPTNTTPLATSLPRGITPEMVERTTEGYGYYHPQEGTFIKINPQAIFPAKPTTPAPVSVNSMVKLRYGGLKHANYFGPPFSNGATYKFSDADKDQFDKVIINRKIIPQLLLRDNWGTKRYRRKDGGIHIKPENKGKFTDYCGGEVTGECIEKGLNSPSATIRKRANFARNARKWNK